MLLTALPQHSKIIEFLLLLLASTLQAELTQSLQQLSEKAKRASEAIQRLKSSSEHVQVQQQQQTIRRLAVVDLFLQQPRWLVDFLFKII